MTEKQKRLHEAVNYLRLNKLAITQADLANKMDTHAANVSKALKGDERYLTDKFLLRFSNVFGISTNWLLHGEGEMLARVPYINNVQTANGHDISQSAEFHDDTDKAMQILEGVVKDLQKDKEKLQDVIDRQLAIIEALSAKK